MYKEYYKDDETVMQIVRLGRDLITKCDVNTVRRAPRHTISMWFTDLESKMIIDERINLDENQHQIQERNSHIPR